VVSAVTNPGAGSNGDGKSVNAAWRRAGEEAIAVLSAALLWNLPASLWEQVQEAVAGVAAAITKASPDDLWQASEDLDLYGPLRADTRLGDPPRVAAPRAIREQIAELVDTLALELDSEPGRGSTAG
jgi:hypothetical protein